MNRIFLAVSMALVLSGCGEPKIDGHSEQALKDSIGKVGGALSDAKRKEFVDSVMMITMSKVDFSKVMSGKQNADTVSLSVNAELDGKTANQVIARAQEIREARELKEQKQAVDEVAELIAKRDNALKASGELKKFAVSKSRFSLRSEQYSSMKQPIIELSVDNGTNVAISRAYFKGTLASPGRSVPWYTDDFNYEISGGLEPGEKASWHLAPNKFSDWGKVEAPTDAVFTVEVIRLDGADKKAIYDATGLSESQTERLARLQKKYQTNQ